MRRRLIVLYFVLLGTSWIWRLASPGGPLFSDNVQVAKLSDGVRVAYRRFGPENSDDTILLLHGSPMAGRSMIPLAEALHERLPASTVLVPDLPGFANSAQTLSDYSFLAHSAHMNGFLDALGVTTAHVIAYSQGGGVALSLYANKPERLRSLTMLSAIGVQELELLGDYHRNHAVHGVQLAVLTGVDWLVPHFGLLDGGLLNVAYARNFYDSDQRPLRKILRSLAVPVLILHGQDDPLVPPAVASEHERIVAHSELQWFAGGHGLAFQRPDDLSRTAADFIGRANAGLASSAADATSDRLVAAQVPFDRNNFAPSSGIALAIVALAIVLFSYISEDLAAIGAGLLAALGTISYAQGVMFAFVGIYTGDMLVYLAGRLAKNSVRGPSRIAASRRFAAGRAWFERRGGSAVVLARFVPGTRFAVFFSAGALGMSVARFSVLLIAPALVWTPALVGLSYAGGQTLAVFEAYRSYALLGLLLLGFLLWLALKLPRLFAAPVGSNDS